MRVKMCLDVVDVEESEAGERAHQALANNLDLELNSRAHRAQETDSKMFFYPTVPRRPIQYNTERITIHKYNKTFKN